MSVKIISPGLLTTVQDAGRIGYQEFGFSPSGALDLRALRAANMLVGNELGEAVLEMNFLGATMEFGEDCAIALTGADMAAALNGQPVANYTALKVSAGDRLTMSGARQGMCAYLAVSGGFDIQPEMGSRSTGLKFAAGGYCGRKLMANDQLPLRRPGLIPPRFEQRSLPAPAIQREVVLRVIPGPQDDMFDFEALARFFGTAYRVSDKLDRMGVRLEGQPLTALKGSSDIISDGTATGAVQITSDGQPIILRQDRQTTGGYAKIACVITVDLPLVAQLTPGCSVNFEKISVEKAQRLLEAEQKTADKLNRRLNR